MMGDTEVADPRDGDKEAVCSPQPQAGGNGTMTEGSASKTRSALLSLGSLNGGPTEDEGKDQRRPKISSSRRATS